MAAGARRRRSGAAEGAVAAAGRSESRSAAGAAWPGRCPPLSRRFPPSLQARPPGPPSRPPAAMIAEKLREALEPGRREAAELGRPLAAAARSVLQQRIEFVPARRGLAGQLGHLRGKYEHIGAEAVGRPPGVTGSVAERPQNTPGECRGRRDPPALLPRLTLRSPQDTAVPRRGPGATASPRRRRCSSRPTASP